MLRYMLAAALFLIMTAAGQAQTFKSYDEAHKAHAQNGLPIVVFIGTADCHYCQAMRKQVFPQIERMGGFAKVNLAYVDAEKDPVQATQIEPASARSVPYLVVFTRSPQGAYSRSYLAAYNNVQQTLAFLRKVTGR